MIRQAYGIDPDTLADEEWCKLYAETLYLNKLHFLNLKAAVMAAVAAIFGNGNDNNPMDT